MVLCGEAGLELVYSPHDGVDLAPQIILAIQSSGEYRAGRRKGGVVRWRGGTFYCRPDTR